ncbi:MAG: nucleoside deaminase, partial [bacterium]
NQQIIASSGNLKEYNYDPCGHAEIKAIRTACQNLKNWRLSDCTLYVTLEPCLMCLAAMIQARIGRLVFGAYDGKGGALSLGYEMQKDARLNHNFAVMGGIKRAEASVLLTNFFVTRRKNKATSLK